MADFKKLLKDIEKLPPTEQYARRQAFFDKEVISLPEYLQLESEDRDLLKREIVGEAPPTVSLFSQMSSEIKKEFGVGEPGPVESLGILLNSKLLRDLRGLDIPLKAMAPFSPSHRLQKLESSITGKPPAATRGLEMVEMAAAPLASKLRPAPRPFSRGPGGTMEFVEPPSGPKTPLGTPSDPRELARHFNKYKTTPIPPETPPEVFLRADLLLPSETVNIPKDVADISNRVVPVVADRVPNSFRTAAAKILGKADIPRIAALTPPELAKISNDPAFKNIVNQSMLSSDISAVIRHWFTNKAANAIRDLSDTQFTRVAKALDGGSFAELSDSELYAATKLRALFDESADLVGLEKGQRITHYFPRLRDAYFVERRELKLGDNLFVPQSMIDALPEKMLRSWFMKEREVNLPATNLDKSVLEAYARGIGRQISLHGGENPVTGEKVTGLLKTISEDFKRVSDDMVDYTTEYIEDLLGRPTKFRIQQGEAVPKGYSTIQTLKAAQFARTIGGNVLSAALNTAQSLNTFAISKPRNWVAAWGDLRNPELVALAKKHGVIDDLSKTDVDILHAVPITEDMSLGQAAATGGKNFINAAAERLGRPFHQSENLVRLQAFFTGLREANDAGKFGTEAADFAKLEYVYPTQFKYSREALPSSFRKPGIGELAQQFRTYTINQGQFIGNLITTNPKAAAKWFGMQSLLFGTTPTTLGFDEVLNEAWNHVTNRKDKLTFTGAFPSVGLYIANQVGLGVLPIERARDLWFYLPGVWGGQLEDAVGIATYGVNKLKGDLAAPYGYDIFGKALTPDQLASKITRMIPVGGIMSDRLRKSYRDIMSEGAYRSPTELSQAFGGVPAGGTMIEPKPKEVLGQVFDAARTLSGFTPPEREQKFRQAEVEQQREQESNYVTRTAAQLRLQGSPSKALALEEQFFRKHGAWPSRPVEALEDAKERSILTPEQRRFLRMQKQLRPQALEERRARGLVPPQAPEEETPEE